MAFGLEVRNSTGNVVIDTVYQNLSLQVKKDFSLSAGGTTTVVATNCVSPLLCVNSTDYVGMFKLQVSGSTYTWTVEARYAATGSLYVFDRPHPAHASTFGMKVMAADGVTEFFNSDNKYFRVQTLLNVPYTAGIGGNPTFGYTTGDTVSTPTLPSAKYAVCISQPRCIASVVDQNINLYRFTFDGSKTTATSATVSQVVQIDFYAGGGGEMPGIFALSGSGTVPALIVNVEGF